jgi:hypothetical protein
MRKLALGVVGLLALAVVSFATQKAKTFSGQIMDSQCAKMGSHEMGYKMTNTSTPRDCTLACVRAGGHFVLYDAAHNVTYQLDDQKKPEAFAGENVKVVGTYDSTTKTIHVEKIEAAR